MITMFRSILLVSMISLIMACNGQNPPESTASAPIHSAAIRLEKPQNGFNSGLVDQDGNLWFGSFGNGVFRFDGQNFSQITVANGLCNDEINTIAEDEEGNIWLGTSNGLCKYDGAGFTHVPIPFQDTTSVWLDQVYPVINPNAVHSIIQDKKGNYWIGTGGGGAYRYDGENFTSILADEGTKYEDSLYHNWIPDIAEDQEGNIWFASMSYGGLNRFDGHTYTKYLQKDGLSDDMVRKIFVDKNGKVWLGFNGNRKSALTVYDGASFRIIAEKRDACHRNIRAIHEDQNGKLWLGGEGGICILAGNHFTEFLNNNGQPFSGIIFMVEDESQQIWFGGRNGLWKYDGKEVVEITGE